MYELPLLTIAALLVSFLAGREKTLRAVRVAAKRFVAILPRFIPMLLLVAVVLYLVPERVIARYLGTGNLWAGVLFASLLGSVSVMPGFIAFPLCGILLAKGVPYTVLAAFSTTLMTVGVVSAPVEMKYLGLKVTLLRNGVSFLLALIVALAVGLIFGEIPR
ncbi:MAG: conserved protein, permease-related protein [Candidatus Tectomicrobia bacterium RIFCSPLOWO2_12_FULL_69_37]|nr:MAG: conserved protein, permease-related protein [Candidatus Tectomicrobia bacterium RIFCSPLOWO2_12_FULL_69_37]